MRLLVGMVLGAALVYGATAYASSSHRAAIPAPECRNSGPTYWVCTFPDPKSNRDIYALKVPGLDLTCDLKGPLNGFTDEAFNCTRSSRPTHACTHYGVGRMRLPNAMYGSLSVSISAWLVFVDKPAQCIPVNDPYGYDVPSLGPSYKFWRLP
jgi:hypothetical protein